VRLEELGKLKKFNDLIGIRSRHLPACNIVPQPTTLSCASDCLLTNSLGDHSVTFNYKFSLKTATKCLTLLKWSSSHLRISATTYVLLVNQPSSVNHCCHCVLCCSSCPATARHIRSQGLLVILLYILSRRHLINL
jgi:hypothetical protein